jgi:hypothetical protein
MGAGNVLHPDTHPSLHPSHDLPVQRGSACRRHQQELARNAIHVMNANAQRTRFSVLSLFVLFITGEIPLSMVSLDAQSVTSAPCSGPEYHQFDFWIGDWDAFDFGTSTKDAQVRVDRILDRCVIHEDYRSVDGHKGESLSIYDASRKVWHQTWVTNRGQLLIIEGDVRDGAMVLAGVDRTTSGESATFAAFGNRWTAACANPLSPQPTAARPGIRGST